jgi:hypothetical protein
MGSHGNHANWKWVKTRGEAFQGLKIGLNEGQFKVFLVKVQQEHFCLQPLVLEPVFGDKQMKYEKQDTTVFGAIGLYGLGCGFVGVSTP